MPKNSFESTSHNSQSINETEVLPIRNHTSHSQMIVKLKEKCLKFTKLEFGWDGYKGIAVPLERAKLATRLIENLVTPLIPRPDVVPGCNGSIQIEWCENGYELEIELTSRAMIDVLLTELETDKMFELKLNLRDKTESDIYAILSEYVSKLIEQ